MYGSCVLLFPPRKCHALLNKLFVIVDQEQKGKVSAERQRSQGIMTEFRGKWILLEQRIVRLVGKKVGKRGKSMEALGCSVWV